MRMVIWMEGKAIRHSLLIIIGCEEDTYISSLSIMQPSVLSVLKLLNTYPHFADMHTVNTGCFRVSLSLPKLYYLPTLTMFTQAIFDEEIVNQFHLVIACKAM